MRIASLISAGTEMLYALGLGHQVVAISHDCDWPPQCRHVPRVTRSDVNAAAESAAIDELVRSLIQNGRPLYEIDVRRLVELEPDLIVTQAQCDVCAVRYVDVLRAVQSEPRLRAAHVMCLNPRSLADVFDDLIRLGAATGIVAEAHRIVAGLRARIERAGRHTAAIPLAKRPRVAIIEWTDPLMLAGNWVPELIEIAGGRCELVRQGEPSRTHRWEELLRFDPHVIVVCPCGFNRSRAAAETELLSHRTGWRDLTAVKTNRVFVLDGNAYFNRPGPRLVDSTEVLANLCLADAGSATTCAPPQTNIS